MISPFPDHQWKDGRHIRKHHKPIKQVEWKKVADEIEVGKKYHDGPQ
jgi:hypothetical protein